MGRGPSSHRWTARPSRPAPALRRVFGAEPVFTREGGSIPVATVFQQALGTPVVFLGFGLPDDNLHAPNEKFYLPNFYRGIEASIAFLEEMWGRDLAEFQSR